MTRLQFILSILLMPFAWLISPKRTQARNWYEARAVSSGESSLCPVEVDAVSNSGKRLFETFREVECILCDSLDQFMKAGAGAIYFHYRKNDRQFPESVDAIHFKPPFTHEENYSYETTEWDSKRTHWLVYPMTATRETVGEAFLSGTIDRPHLMRGNLSETKCWTCSLSNGRLLAIHKLPDTSQEATE